MARDIYLLGILCIVGFQRTSANGVPEVGIGFEVEPMDVVVARGRSVALPCVPHHDGPHDVTIRWEKDNVPLLLAGDRRRELRPDGTLFIRKAQWKGEDGISDAGEYRCIAQSPTGSLSSRPAILRFAGFGHNFSSSESPVIGAVGGNVRLWCHIEATPGATVTWERDDTPLPHDTTKYITVPPGELLYILNLVPEDSAKYRCTATNVVTKKSRMGPPVFVNVLPLSSSGYRPNEFLPSVPRGDALLPIHGNVTLECATHIPSPLSWSLNSKELTQVTTTGVNLLELQATSGDISGNYTCHSGPGGPAMSRRVVVHTPPTIVDHSEGQLLLVARTIRFTCKVQGRPLPQVYWLKDGVRVNINGRLKHKENRTSSIYSSELVVSSSVALDSGIYQCMAYNDVGVVWAASRLNLTVPHLGRPAPQPPTGVMCDPLTASQVLVSWVHADHTAKAFTVHYSLTDGGGEHQLVTGPHNRSAVVEKLLPYTNYTFSVRGYTESASDFSEKVVCLTGEEVPIAAPLLQFTSTNPNSVRVTWQPLPSNLSRGVIVEYRVQWRRKGTPSYHVETVTAHVLDYTIIGLSPGLSYEVRVLAATRQGLPVVAIPWAEYSMPPKENADLPVAPNVTVTALNSSAVRAAWNLTNRELLGYKLYLRPQFGPMAGPFHLFAGVTSHVFNELVPETSYDVMVLGYTIEGDGEMSVTSIHTPPRESVSLAPEPPAQLDATPLNSTAILLTWSDMVGANFTVCYNRAKNNPAPQPSNPTCLPSAKNMMTIVNLVPFTLYEFRVRSTDAMGRNSSYSHAVECPTQEGFPTEVRRVHWTLVNKSAIRVTWLEPERANGLLKNYTISFAEDSSLPMATWQSVTVPSNKYSAELVRLEVDARYVVAVRAATGAGYGAPGYTATPVSLIGGRRPSSPQSNEVVPSQDEPDHSVGVIVGSSIGVICIVLCGVCLLCQRRCSKTRCTQQQTPRGASSGGTNGHEMDYLSQYAAADPQHVDSKGHYPNGVVNGVRHPLVTNGSAIHITDNPRYDPSSSESPILGLQTFAPITRPSTALSGDASILRCGSTSSRTADTLPTSLNGSPSTGEPTTPINESQLPLLDTTTPPATTPIVSNLETVSHFDIVSNPEFTFSTEIAEPRSIGCWLRSPVVCSGSDSIPFAHHVRAKSRSPVASIFDVPDSPPGKHNQLIIADYNFA